MVDSIADMTSFVLGDELRFSLSFSEFYPETIENANKTGNTNKDGRYPTL